MSIADAFNSARQTVHNAVSTAAKKAGQVVDNVKDTVSDVKEKIVNDAVELSGKAKDFIDDTIEKGHAWEEKHFGDEADLNKAMEEAGVDDEHVINIMGTDKADNIDISANLDGSYKVTVNGEVKEYSAEEAKRLNIYGGDGDDNITIHRTENGHFTNSADAAIYVNGGNGNDNIEATTMPSGNNAPHLYMTGGRGDDNIKGGNGDDTIIDNYGSNVIDAGVGDDKITAMGRSSEQGLFGMVASLFSGRRGAESNIIESGSGNDTVTTGNGDDIISNSNGADLIYSNGGADSITLSGKARYTNEVYAGDGDDTINGSAGRDYIEGGAGDDRIFGNDGSDVIYGGQGHDYIEGNAGDDFVNAGAGNDNVYGGEGNDTIFGLSGHDNLYGNEGRDTIAGGKGTDSIDGGAGDDTLRYTNSDKNGHDTILNANDADNTMAVEPIKVPRNIFVSPLESKGFKENMRDNLEAFADIEPGQKLLQGIGKTGQPVYFTHTSDQNGYATPLGFTSDAKITENDDGTRSYKSRIGCGTKIQINPAYIGSDGPAPWSADYTMTVMAHEMCHAYNNASGNKDVSYYNNDTGESVKLPAGISSNEAFGQRAVKGAELQAVGIYDNSTVAPNPYGISENDYRQFFHMAPRTSYMSQTSAQLALSNHGDINVEEWAKLYQ